MKKPLQISRFRHADASNYTSTVVLSEHYYIAVVDHFTDWKSVSTVFVIVLCSGQMHVFFNIFFLLICCVCSSVHCSHPGNS